MQKPTFADITAKAKSIYAAMKKRSKLAPFKLWNNCMAKAAYLLREAYKRFLHATRHAHHVRLLEDVFDTHYEQERYGKPVNGIYDHISNAHAVMLTDVRSEAISRIVDSFYNMKRDIKDVFRTAKFEYKRPKRKVSRSGMFVESFKNSKMAHYWQS